MCYGVIEVSEMLYNVLVYGVLILTAILSIGNIVIDKVESHKRKKQQ